MVVAHTIVIGFILFIYPSDIEKSFLGVFREFGVDHDGVDGVPFEGSPFESTDLWGPASWFYPKSIVLNRSLITREGCWT